MPDLTNSINETENFNVNADGMNYLLDVCHHISEAINIPISYDSIKFLKSTNRLTIYMIMYMPSNDRMRFSVAASDYIKANPKFISQKAKRPYKEFCFKLDKFPQTIYVYTKPTSSTSARYGTDPHELMTAALCLTGRHSMPVSLAEMDSLIDTIKDVCQKGLVKGFTPEQYSTLDKDYCNLSSAISAANSILNNSGHIWNTVYLTSRKWPYEHDKRLELFNIKKYGMKQYNSADFILSDGCRYLGISLKKKQYHSASDPTLINIPLTFLVDDDSTELKNYIIDKIRQYYIALLRRTEYLDEVDKNAEDYIKKWKKYIKHIPCNYINQELKAADSIFKDISHWIISCKHLICDRLLKIVYKHDLLELNEHNFDFALVTGVGRYGVRSGINILEGEYYRLSDICGYINQFKIDNVIDITPQHNINESESIISNTASCSFILTAGSMPVLKVIIRYKGNYSDMPCVQATIPEDFKTLICSKNKL